MLKMEIDEKRNALIVTIKGTFTSREAAEATNIFKYELQELDEGFSVINDISDFESIEEGAMILLLEALEILDAKKPKKIIRIENDASTGRVFFDQAFQRAHIGYQLTKAGSMQDALDILDSD